MTAKRISTSVVNGQREFDRYVRGEDQYRANADDLLYSDLASQPALPRIKINYRRVSIASLRKQIGILPQHVLLLDVSVADNIAYGRPDASSEEIEAAAKLAHADGFIRALPDGYATRIGHEGIRLSGGQRQRLALARALLKDPPILVLDEATAMFDPEAEKAFLDEVVELMKSKTVLLITHRPASLALSDRVVRMKA